MSHVWELESFDSAAPINAAQPIATESALEDERLQSFDKGYKAGWDDAARAHSEEQAHISAELASNLQALSFTYHEARSVILGEMEGILKELLAQVLPQTMRHSLGEMIVERISEVAGDAAEVDAEVVVCPDNLERVQRLVDGMIAPPLVIRAESSLGEGQAYIRLDHSESKIDLEGVLQGLSEAVAEFFEAPEHSEVSNG